LTLNVQRFYKRKVIDIMSLGHPAVRPLKSVGLQAQGAVAEDGADADDVADGAEGENCAGAQGGGERGEWMEV
jgi:hypothetical protein